jgi:N-methylhydantoinase B
VALSSTDALASGIKLIMPGGGGYGDPRTRDHDSVRRDVREGFVSREAAVSAYGLDATEVGE